MHHLLLSASVLLFLACGTRQPADAEPVQVDDPSNDFGFAFEADDSQFTRYIDTAAGIDVLASGFTWSEGPVWVPALNSLLFSDVPNNVIYQWSASAKTLVTPSAEHTIVGVDTFLYPSGYYANPAIPGEAGSNGLLLDGDGALLMAQHGERQLARYKQVPGQGLRMGQGLARAEDLEVLVGTYEGKRFNSPNDLAQLANGDLLFTDPTYGVDKTFGKDARELEFAGVYRLAHGAEEAELLLSTMTRPNGIVLTAGDTAMIVANSDPKQAQWLICPFALQPTELDAPWCRVFADATHRVSAERPGNADGMVMLPSGVLLATGPGGVWTLAPDGTHLGTIRTGRATANVTTGGADGRDVFITADDLLLRVRLR